MVWEKVLFELRSERVKQECLSCNGMLSFSYYRDTLHCKTWTVKLLFNQPVMMRSDPELVERYCSPLFFLVENIIYLIGLCYENLTGIRGWKLVTIVPCWERRVFMSLVERPNLKRKKQRHRVNTNNVEPGPTNTVAQSEHGSWTHEHGPSSAHENSNTVRRRITN